VSERQKLKKTREALFQKNKTKELFFMNFFSLEKKTALAEEESTHTGGKNTHARR